MKNYDIITLDRWAQGEAEERYKIFIYYNQ